jgi:hypothetical protein
MTILFKILLWILFTNFAKTARIVGKITSGKNFIIKPLQIPIKLPLQTNPQCITKDKEVFLEENNFIENKKLISISSGGLKGFYELGVLSYIKDNYDMENFIFSGASVGAWNALFMCYKNDSKKFVHDLLDYKSIKMNDIKEVKYFLKYEVLPSFSNDDFDLRRLFLGVTRLKQFKPVTNIFSDFNNLEDAVKCCIASSHIPLITGGLTNKYYDMYRFDNQYTNNKYSNFTENVRHISPSMLKKLNVNQNDNVNENIKQAFLNPFTILNIDLESFMMLKNKNYAELFDNGYEDAKKNKEYLDKIFLETKTETENVVMEHVIDKTTYYKVTHEYDDDNDNNYKIDFYSKDNDSY